MAATSVLAQARAPGRYFPLDQTAAPGVASRFTGAGTRRACPAWQVIRVELPGDEGRVSIYTAPDGEQTSLEGSNVAAIRVGSVYRLRLAELPDFPGAEWYPTVELLDGLHPPRGREVEFPIPITFTDEELRLALEGRLVTKVVYLEQPDLAIPERNSTAARSRLAAPHENALAVADEMGRPMAIVRLGGRLPDLDAPDPGFFGTGAPVQFLKAAPRAGESRP